jgi:hypothetical protein
MITSIWKHEDDICPKVSGHYLAYKLPSFGDSEEGYGLYYWDNYYTEWRESKAPHSHSIKVSIWTECPEHDPDNHISLQPLPAELSAWKKVCEAIDYFNIITKLVK